MKKMIDFIPTEAETGVGLVIKYKERYLFFLAGTRYNCSPKEIFYAGIGGHKEDGEDWLTCAHREAKEEIGADVEILPSDMTYHISQHSLVGLLEVVDNPRPFALYEMIHSSKTPRAGQLYYIVVYNARLKNYPTKLKHDEVQGIIALTKEQVILSLKRKPTLLELKNEGALILAGAEFVKPETRLYPIGTAKALAHILALT